MRERKVEIFTRPIDQQTSGSGSHLRQLVDHLLQVNDTFDIYLIHYKKGDLDTYKKTKEIIIPRDPLRVSIKLQRRNFAGVLERSEAVEGERAPCPKAHNFLLLNLV